MTTICWSEGTWLITVAKVATLLLKGEKSFTSTTHHHYLARYRVTMQTQAIDLKPETRLLSRNTTSLMLDLFPYDWQVSIISDTPLKVSCHGYHMHVISFF